MNVEVIAASELTSAHYQRWQELRQSNPDLLSPYFHPEFTAATARAHHDVDVAVIEKGGEPVGFFPFHRRRFGLARPVGDLLSDYHGIIAAQDARFDARRLLRASNLTVWPFDHALACQTTFQPFAQTKTRSPIVDLRNGFQAYVDARKKAGSNRISQMQRKARKLAREVGPVRLDTHVDDSEVLDQIIRWKSEQCRRANIHDCFSDEPAVRLVRNIASTKVDGFEGLVSVLYVGDSIAAAHMGMRSKGVLHWWFPTYQHSLSKYSPGSILLMLLAEEMAKLGVVTLDLGKGESPYKAAFMTGAVPLIEGVVDVPSAPAMIRRARIRGERWLRRSPMLKPVRKVVRRARKGVDVLAGS
jgi:CelD/BcsL family acetyltransferase involved in cellulose biosynthesis